MAGITSRVVVTQTLATNPELIALGLPEGEVYQADTLDSPTTFPFLVIRWLDEQNAVGASSARPAEIWSYDEPGSYDRCLAIGDKAMAILGNLVGLPTDFGHISQFRVQGPGLGRGADLWDDGYKAVVIPFRFVAVARGL